MNFKRLLLPAALLTLAFVGCSSKGEEAPAAATSGCRARITIFCRCQDGEPGWQTCDDEGSAFGDCGPCDGSSGEGGGEGSSPPLSASCGNGRLEGSEQCDDGNLDDTDDCTSTCRGAKCGDGFVQQDTEQCDDGNEDDTDDCSNECKAVQTCKPAAVEVPAGAKIVSKEGDLKAAAPRLEGSCGGLGRESIFSFTTPISAKMVVAVSTTSLTLDFVLYVREGACDSVETERCSDNAGPGKSEAVTLHAEKGKSYVVVVDTKVDDPGPFSLVMQLNPDAMCDDQGQACKLDKPGICADGKLACNPADQQLFCKPDFEPAAKDTCGDGLDNDCDGVVDNGCPCAHDKCTKGAALVAKCGDPCVEKLCAMDASCCTDTWDEHCIEEVVTVCDNIECAGSCAHSACEVGAKLTPGCDKPSDCVAAICATDAFCCEDTWDELCIEKIKDICSGATCD